MEKTYFVREVADITGISEHTIRFYDNKNLIPNMMRDHNNKRVFSQNAINWLYFINAFRKSGLDLKSIKRYIDLYLEGEHTLPERYELIDQQEIKLKETIQDLNAQLKMIIYKKQICKEHIDGNTHITFDIKEWEKMAANS